MNKKLIAACVATMALATCLPVSAQQDPATDAQQLRASLLTLVRTLLDQNLITVAKAQEMLRQAGIDPAALQSPVVPAAPPAAPAPPVVRVPYVPEAVKRELRDEIRQEVMATARAERWAVPEALPAWLSRFSFNGDVRLRLQHDAFAADNAVPAQLDSFYQLLSSTGQATTVNTTENRDRLRVRARLGVVGRVSDDVQAGLRIVTSKGGDANDPASANVDTGQNERRFGIALDEAYVGWGLGPYSVSGGRIANPYQTTDLLWSNDLTLDGVAASWRPHFGYEWSAFATLGVHPLHEVNNSLLNRAQDSWLIGAQAGVAWKPGTGWSLRGGVGLFDFKRIEARLNPAGAGDGTTTDYNDAAPLVRTRGNTMFNIAAESNPSGGPVWGVASKFRVLDFNLAGEYMTPELWRFGVQADYLNNIGWDRDEIAGRIGSAAAALPGDNSCGSGAARLDCRRTKGYRLEFIAGRGLPDDEGSWAVNAGTRHLERDAVPDGFTTGDYRLGGTDVKASFIGGSYTLARNTQLAIRYVNAKGIDSPVPLRIGTWTVDLLARF
ncbi:MAG: putative porin [Rhizobacter sp.]